MAQDSFFAAAQSLQLRRGGRIFLLSRVLELLLKRTLRFEKIEIVDRDLAVLMIEDKG
jgi:hypothetical protein